MSTLEKAHKLLINSIACVVAAGLLSGCLGTTQPSRFYALTTEPIDAYGGEATLGIGPLDLPDYLNRPQIVVRGENQQIILNEFDRWGEPFSRGINRRVASTINKLNDDIWAYEFLRASASRSDYRLAGQILRFEADQTNTVTLEILWGVFNRQELSTSTNLNLQHGYYTATADVTDMNAVTEAMGEVLDQFGGDVSAMVSKRIATDSTESALQDQAD